MVSMQGRKLPGSLNGSDPGHLMLIFLLNCHIIPMCADIFCSEQQQDNLMYLLDFFRLRPDSVGLLFH